MRQARRQGAAVVWISTRPGKRFKAFRPHHMRQLDLHLVIDTSSNRRLRLHEKLLGLFSPRTRVQLVGGIDRKSTRLNSSHVAISYAVFCLKKKNIDRCGRTASS